MFYYILMLIEPKLNLFRCLYWRIIVLEYGSVWKQYAGYGKNIVIDDIEIVIGSNLATYLNDRTS